MASKDPQPDSTSIPDSDTSTMYTPTATTEDMPATLVEGPQSRSGIPSDGLTFIIRAMSSENVLTLLDGNVVLAPIGNRGCIYWGCVEYDGWFGFRSCSSNMFICHGWDGRLKCTAQLQDGWRHFTVTPMPRGGYIMQMLDWFVLRSVVVNPENGLQKLGRTGRRLSEGVVWEFIQVEPELVDASRDIGCL